MKKIFGAVSALALMAAGLVACGDDSSSPSAPNGNAPANPGAAPTALPDTVKTFNDLVNTYKCNATIKCAHVYLAEMDNDVMECDGSAWAHLSDYIPSVCGYDLNAQELSSSSMERLMISSSSVPTFEPATDCYYGGADITITNIENLNMQCGGSTEGMRIYDKDHWILYTCKSGQWLEEEAFPCAID